MAKFRFDSINGQKLEWEGSPEELLFIYDGLKQREIASKSKEIKTVFYGGKHYRAVQSDIIRLRQQLKTEEQLELEAKMPTTKEIVEYILSKPRYEHDIIDVSIKFFNKQIQSREYGSLYRKLALALEKARKQIEIEKHGAFERKSGRPRNLQVYSFRQVNATLLDTTPERTS